MKLDPKKIIISRPEKLTKTRSKLENTITALGWIIWAFCCRPLILLVLWATGFSLYYVHMLKLKGINSLITFLGGYLAVIVGIYLVIQGWGLYNKLRFGKKNQRRKSSPVTPEEIDRYFRMKEGTCRRLQSWKEIRIDFEKDGRMKLSRMESGSSKAFEARYRYPKVA